MEPAEGGAEGRRLSTQLREDSNAGIAVGGDGDFDSLLELAVSYDSRDFEPNPPRGILAETMAELSFEGLGSERTYQRLTFSGSYFHGLCLGGLRLGGVAAATP